MIYFDNNGVQVYPDLGATSRRADAAKLSYGEYVAKNGVVFSMENPTKYTEKGYHKTCEFCGNGFVSKLARARFCCPECRVKYNRRNR